MALIIGTHLYKKKLVQFIEDTYTDKGNQYCTILMINKAGHLQRQTVQKKNLLPVQNPGLSFVRTK